MMYFIVFYTQREEVVVPDGGWGWFIVFGSFLCHFIIGGMDRSAGLLYLYFLERFRQSAATTAWATTIASAIRLMLGRAVPLWAPVYPENILYDVILLTSFIHPKIIST